MKNTLLRIVTLLTLTATAALAHQKLEIGPNGGRVFKLDSQSTPNLEVTSKDGNFVIYVLDAAKKPIAIGDRVLAITAGDRSKPEKLAVEKAGETFTAPIPKGNEYPVVFQVRDKEGAKASTARMNYDAKTCGECKKPEWLCSCGAE